MTTDNKALADSVERLISDMRNCPTELWVEDVDGWADRIAALTTSPPLTSNPVGFVYRHLPTGTETACLERPDDFLRNNAETCKFVRWLYDAPSPQADKARGEVEWTKRRPTRAGVYGVRGFNLGRDPVDQFEAIVAVRLYEDELVCNLHESTSEDDFDRWTRLLEISDRFEWCEFTPQRQGDASGQVSGGVDVADGFALVDRSVIPTPAVEMGKRMLALARQMGWNDEATALLVFTEMVPLAALSTPQARPDGVTYSSKQATECAGCGQRKHTPLRIDAMGGYVCLTCIDKKLGSLLGEFGYEQARPDGGEVVAWVDARAAIHDAYQAGVAGTGYSKVVFDLHDKLYLHPAPAPDVARLVKEYRPTMGAEVLHSWAQDVVRAFIATQQEEG